MEEVEVAVKVKETSEVRSQSRGSNKKKCRNSKDSQNWMEMKLLPHGFCIQIKCGN